MVLLSRRVKIVLGIAIVAVLFAVFLLPGFAEGESGIQTTLYAGTPDGEVAIYQEGGLFGATIVALSGTQVTYFRWVTTVKAESPNYDRYTFPSGNFIHVYLLKPDGTRCGSGSDYVASVGSTSFSSAEFQTGVWYNVGQDVLGQTEDHTIKVTSEEIVTFALDRGCPDTGDYKLVYDLFFVVEAVGAGDLPRGNVAGNYKTTLTFADGTISATESTTASSG